MKRKLFAVIKAKKYRKSQSAWFKESLFYNDTKSIANVTIVFFIFLFRCGNFLLTIKKESFMEKTGKRNLITGVACVVLFTIWTMLIKAVDVQPVGINGTEIGFATINKGVHLLTGVNWYLYSITDWLGLVPVFVCIYFGFVGFVQLVKRKSFLKVDKDIIYLGIYYVIVILGYLIFEMIPINYRPILINGFMEASYPSSTTLLVLSVMPTLDFQVSRRVKSNGIKRLIRIITVLFSLFMVVGRLISGVHWLTDIIGSLLLSAGVFYVYKGAVLMSDKK